VFKGYELSGIAIGRFAVMNIDVDLVRAVTPEVVQALGRLLPQLSSTARPLDEDEVARLDG
jgi:hypothetical protein